MYMIPNILLCTISICDRICEKGPYSLSKFPSFTDNNHSCIHPIAFTLHHVIVLCLIKFQTGTIFTSQVMCCQVHAIGQAIRLLFADPVTYKVLFVQQRAMHLKYAFYTVHRQTDRQTHTHTTHTQHTHYTK